jgi:hypothetical protein
MCHITSQCFLQFNVTDSWRWQLDPCAGYTVRGAYQLLTSQDTSLVDHTTDLIWHKQVGSSESFNFCLEVIAGSVAYTVELVGLRHYHGWWGGLFGGLWSIGEFSAFILILRLLWLIMACGAVLAWCVQTGSSQHLRSFVSVYSFGGRFACKALIFAASLTTLCFDYMGNDRSNINFVFGCTSRWSNLLFCLDID